METANRMWNLLDKDHPYGILLINIINKIIHGYKDFDYQKIFWELWEQIPNAYKKHIFRVGFDRRIVSDLFKLRDENIKLIFQAASPGDKKYLIYDDNGQDICKDLMKGNQLSLLKYFIKACLPSKEEVVEFKEDFDNDDVWRVSEHLMTSWQHEFLLVLDDVVCEFRKRTGRKIKHLFSIR